jgi:hypothetical protein
MAAEINHALIEHRFATLWGTPGIMAAPVTATQSRKLKASYFAANIQFHLL